MQPSRLSLRIMWSSFGLKSPSPGVYYYVVLLLLLLLLLLLFVIVVK
jgi:hypothetical protein